MKSISPQGEVRPLCELDRGDTRKTVKHAAVPAICSAAAAGRLRSAPWRAVDLPESLVRERKTFPHNAEAVRVDLAGDGSSQTVLRYHIDSTADCGGRSTELVIVSKDMKTVDDDSAVAERLQSIRTDDRADVLLFGKHAYVLGSMNSKSTPALLTLAVDPPQEVCSFTYTETYAVGRMFPLDGNSPE